MGPLDFNRLRIVGQVYSGSSRGSGWSGTGGGGRGGSRTWSAAGRAGPGRRSASTSWRRRPSASSQPGQGVGLRGGRGPGGGGRGRLLRLRASYVGPDEWSLFLSVQFVAIVLVGGERGGCRGRSGAVLLGGAPALVEELSVAPAIGGLGLTVANLNRLLFGLLVVGFVVLAPRGLAGTWRRAGGPRLAGGDGAKKRSRREHTDRSISRSSAIVVVVLGAGGGRPAVGATASPREPPGLGADAPGFDLSSATIRVALLTPSRVRSRSSGSRSSPASGPTSRDQRQGGVGGRFEVEVVARGQPVRRPRRRCSSTRRSGTR